MRRTHRLNQLLVISAALLFACKSESADDTGNTAGSGGTTGSGGMVAAGSGGKGSAAGSGGATGSGGKAAAGSGGMAAAGSGGKGSGGATVVDAGMKDGGAMMGGPLKLMSMAFMDGKVIDAKYRCTGPSPALSWTGKPADGMSFAIVFKDVTPGGISNGYLHWVIYDIPGSTTSLDEMVPIGAMPAKPMGAKQAPIWNDTVGFNGPCAPSGTNTYEMTLHAIDVAMLAGVTASSTGAEVVTAIEGASVEMSTITIMSMP